MAAAASDKARFHLEQTVPELQSYAQNKLFSPSEISSIASKRSAFEHRINMAGAASPTDFAAYASYEQTLDALRRKRCARRGVRGDGKGAGQKRVYSILERGTRRFPGDTGLWMQYLDFCRGEAANAKLSRGLTKVLRLMPTRWELWVWAARYYFEQQGDMGSARSYMQRGLRFCGREKGLWTQYAKLEMVYLAKVAARRKVLKLDVEESEIVEEEEGMEKDEIALPGVTAEELEPQIKRNTLSIDDATLKKLKEAPAFSGAIPMAISDAAAAAFKGDASILEDLFDCVLEFADVPCTPAVLRHILGLVPATDKNESLRLSMEAKLEVAGLETSSTEFPSALGRAIIKLKTLPSKTSDQDIFRHQRMVLFLLPFLSSSEVDPDVETVLRSTIQSHVSALRKLEGKKSLGQPNPVTALQKITVQRGIKKRVMLEFDISSTQESTI